MKPEFKTKLIIILLGLISFAVYFNSLHGEYLIDDQAGILNNPNIHSVKGFLLKGSSLRMGVLSEAIRTLCWAVGGGSPFPFHLFNVLMHAACVILLFILCNLLFRNAALSFLAAVIFAVHPIHTEAVSWISGGTYTLASVFFVASFIFYIRSDESLLNLILSVAFFLLCFLSANLAAALPPMFITYDLFFRKKKESNKSLRNCRIVFLAFLCAIAFLALAVFFANRNNFMHTIFYFRGTRYLIVIAKALVYYLKIIYLPVKRGLYHPFAYNTTDTDKVTPALFISIALILVSIIAFFRYRKSAPPVSFAIAWFFIAYLPFSNLIPVCNIVSERYVYLASFGFCLLLAYFILALWRLVNKDAPYRKPLRIIAMTAVILFILSYAILTVMHNRDYRDIITYWETNIKNFPDGYMAYNNLAGTFFNMGQTEQAKAYSWINLMINPDQAHVWYNLGNIYRFEGDLKMARYCYEESLKVDKGYVFSLKALGEVDSALKESKKKRRRKK